ncbi:MAG TPA: glycosyltransferase family 39 protein, partial [Chloroflexota bacterium]|nr:glycosyltransferase family 39 protein [Chloroflexota bacterium]
MSRGRAVEAAAVCLALAAVVAGYLSLAWYGFDLLDEGYFLTHARRVQLGGLPYRDFDTPYTPGVFYLYAWLLERFGPSMELLRTPAVIGRALTFLALYLLARRLTSPFFAALPALVILLIDRAPPYWSIHPGWIATPATLLASLAVVRYLDGGRARWLAGAGAGIAVAFAFKQNLAAFLLMALLWLCAVAERHLPPLSGGGFQLPLPRPALTFGRISAQWLATLLLPLSALVLVRPYLSPFVLALFVAPLAALALVGALRGFGGAALTGPGFYARPLLILAGFSALTLPWLLPLVASLWAHLHLLRGFIGQVDPSGYYYGMTPPGWEHWRLLAIAAAAPLACGAAGAFLGALFSRRWRERVALAGAVPAMTGGVVAFSGVPGYEAPTLGGALDWITHAAGHAWTVYRDTWPHPTDDLVLYLPSLAFWVGAAGLAAPLWTRRTDPDRLVRLWYLAAGACLLLTQYPRMGYGHIVWSGGLLYVVGADRLQALHRIVVGRISPRVGWGVPRGFAVVTVAAALTLLPAAAVLPYLQQRTDWIGAVLAAPREAAPVRGGGHLVPLVVPMAVGELRVWGVADDVRPVLGVVELLKEHSASGEAIFAY